MSVMYLQLERTFHHRKNRVWGQKLALGALHLSLFLLNERASNSREIPSHLVKINSGNQFQVIGSHRFSTPKFSLSKGYLDT